MLVQPDTMQQLVSASPYILYSPLFSPICSRLASHACVLDVTARLRARQPLASLRSSRVSLRSSRSRLARDCSPRSIVAPARVFSRFTARVFSLVRARRGLHRHRVQGASTGDTYTAAAELVVASLAQPSGTRCFQGRASSCAYPVRSGRPTCSTRASYMASAVLCVSISASRSTHACTRPSQSSTLCHLTN